MPLDIFAKKLYHINPKYASDSGSKHTCRIIRKNVESVSVTLAVYGIDR